MKYLFLVGLASAAQNLDGNTCEAHRSCWRGTDLRYPGEWPACSNDTDCDPGHYCLNHMWTYNHQTESGKGCWREEVCAGNGTYDMFVERIQQWFCTEEQHAANAGKEAPAAWGLVPRPEKYWDTYEPACATDADCPRPDLGQVCTKLYWLATQNGSNWTNGENCGNWETPVCPGEEFAAINYNYENTQFSYYSQK